MPSNAQGAGKVSRRNPPGSDRMTAEFGLFFLIVAFLTASLQAIYLLPQPALKAVLFPSFRAASWLQALCITLAFAILMTLRLDSDFSVVNVAAHSNRALPTLYKIAGTWGNHEGSMLLWVLVLSVFGATLSLRPLAGHEQFKTLAVALQSLLCAGFLLFILFTSNPFARQFPLPADGDALNPLLQDIALSLHPPLLYLGYVGFSIVFSMAVAALWQGRMDEAWAKIAHPWILVSWSALTLGIGLGSWWAYRVLGWGGFWFWDPVENASLMPWLCGTALLHANIVLKKRGALKPWVLLLAIVTFAMSLLGTFLVRSGVLTSVHSFASDPARGLFVLIYMAVIIGGALILYALRAGQATADGNEGGMAPLSREGLIVINNMFLLTACATVLLGTLYPMIVEWLYNDKITVGPPYFITTFLPLVAIPLIFAGLTPLMPWQHARLKQALRQARPAAWASLAAALLVLSITQAAVTLAACGMALALWLAVCSIQWISRRGTHGANMAVFLAHFGTALAIAGITGAGVWQQEAERAMRVGDSLDIAGYHVRFEKQSFEDTPNYHAKQARFRVTDGEGRHIAVLTPEYRTYAIRKTAISTAAIHAHPLYDLYAVIGESSADGTQTAVRLYYNPLISLLWAGCILMAAGGIVAIIRRRR